MIDILTQIPGPLFIWLLLLYAALITVIAWFFHRQDGSEKLLLPPSTAFDAYTLAVLRGGWKTVLESVVYGLWKREILDLKPTKGSPLQAARKSNRHVPLTVIEKIVYDFFHHKRNLQDIFKDETVRLKINAHIEPLVLNLQTKHLLKTAAGVWRSYLIFCLALLAFSVVGVTKLYYGLMRDKPVGILFLILLVTPFILYKILKPQRPQTKLGLSFLDSLKEKFDWMKEKARYDDLEGIDPVHVAAIFGVAALSTDSAFANMMKQSTTNTSGWGSSGCGSSGGGGGGGCGGGCGGCGGCG